jgi:hypothetical protein
VPTQVYFKSLIDATEAIGCCSEGVRVSFTRQMSLLMSKQTAVFDERGIADCATLRGRDQT